MRSRTVNQRAFFVGGLLAALLVGSQASAVTIIVSSGPPALGSQAVNITTPISQSTAAGAFAASIDGGPSVLAWCADLFNAITIPGTYTYLPASTLPGDFPNANALANLGALASNALSSVVNAATSAAFQLAIWEILYESTPSAVNAGTGFSVSNNPSSVGIANGWLSSLGGWNNSQNYVVDFYGKAPGVDTQDLIVFRRVPVPEPASFALLLVGGIAGLVVMRRRAT